MLRYLLLAAFACGLASSCYSAEKKEEKTAEKKEEKKVDPKDPLSKYSDEDLADPGIACQKLFEAIGAEEAEVVKAFMAEVPKHLATLDLKKKEDRADTWAFKFAESPNGEGKWTEIRTKKSHPPKRRHLVGTYDAGRNWMVVFGGFGEDREIVGRVGQDLADHLAVLEP